MFRIGHLGDCNDLTLMAALAGCEMGLKLSGVKLAGSGVQAAMDYFAGHAGAGRRCRRRPERPAPFIHNNGDTMQRRSFIQAARRRRGRTSARPACARRTCPTGPVRIVVGFPPGGGTDALARVVAQKLPTMWNQPRSSSRTRRGVAGVLAADYVATQPSDGTTLLMAHINSHAHRAEPAAEAALRRRARLRADRAGRRHAQPADREPDAEGQDREGHRRPVQGQARAGELRLGRHRLRAAPGAGDVHAAGQGRCDARALQGQRARC